ncbi:MAG: hypothetical protein DDT33_01082 [Firmicutes bacterium]|nr:hypothetical protein [Bacillota bacterium]
MKKGFKLVSVLLTGALLMLVLVMPVAGQEQDYALAEYLQEKLDSQDRTDVLQTSVVESNSFAVTARAKRDYRNLFGIVVATHWANTQWGCDLRGTMLSTPRNVWNDSWTAPGYNVSAQGASWNWYNVGVGATAQSNCWVSFVSGLPTPWGPIGGSTLLSRCLTLVNGWGSATASWTP